MCFDVGSGSSVDQASGGVGGVLASLTTMVKECCGSSFIILPPLSNMLYKLVVLHEMLVSVWAGCTTRFTLERIREVLIL